MSTAAADHATTETESLYWRGNADASTVEAFIARAARRLSAIAAAQGAAAGLLFATLVVTAGLAHSVSLFATVLVMVMLVVIGASIGAYIAARQQRETAARVERCAPECRNLLITAHQLLEGQNATNAVTPIVFRQAASVVRKLDAAQLFPTRRAATMLVTSVVLFTLALFIPHNVSLAAPTRSNVATLPAGAIDRIDATIVSPAYVNRPPVVVHNPSRIEALVGSHIKLSVTCNATSLTVETLLGKSSLTAAKDGVFNVDVVADADGFIALQPTSADGTLAARKLIGLSVATDAAPHVRIVAPAKDMMLPDANRAIDLSIESDDDIALSTLTLRYTQVSGSGERYTFKEGELPLQVTRTSEKTWTARVHWNLATLSLDAGDMVVYRAAATDKRPGAIASESDSYIAEIVLPGSEAAAGFSIDPDQERYALSQQMIIVKTERLLAKRASLAPAAFADGANDIAVEQRRVRAEFVFMMGGELADDPQPGDDMTMLNEEEEAEGESDILAGRNANMGRIALQQAIRSMSSAATMLNVANVTEALDREKLALKQVERAFSHTRIILRALTEVERLDLTRRMTGPLLEAGRDEHASANPEESARIIALRNSLAGVAELSGALTAVTDANLRASALAERVLRIAPSEKKMQDVGALLDGAAAAFGKHDLAGVRRQLDSAAISLTAIIRGEIVSASTHVRTLQSERLGGALADLVRHSHGTK